MPFQGLHQASHFDFLLHKQRLEEVHFQIDGDADTLSKMHGGPAHDFVKEAGLDAPVEDPAQPIV